VLTTSLKKNTDFQRVYKKGKSLANRHIVMFVLKNGRKTNRLGISASKKIGKAVVRNKQRRRLKEAFRALESGILMGQDIVVLPRVGIADADFLDVKASIKHLLRKHGLYSRHAP